MKFLWWGLITLSMIAIARVWWFWSGPCWGYSADMDCTLAPNSTWPVAIGVTVVAVLAIAASVMMLRRKSAPTAPAS